VSSLSADGEVDRCGEVVAAPLLLARTEALWLARKAVRAALARFNGGGLVLRMRAGVATHVPGDDDAFFSEVGRVGGGDAAGGGEAVVAIATLSAKPGVGMADGGRLFSASILLSSRLLLLLARSRLCLPVWFGLAASLLVGMLPFA
jgi:hypothetical protein